MRADSEPKLAVPTLKSQEDWSGTHDWLEESRRGLSPKRVEVRDVTVR